jgi:hypothetical protein
LWKSDRRSPGRRFRNALHSAGKDRIDVLGVTLYDAGQFGGAHGLLAVDAAVAQQPLVIGRMEDRDCKDALPRKKRDSAVPELSELHRHRTQPFRPLGTASAFAGWYVFSV